MILRDAVLALEKLGSNQDPIFYLGRETTPESLSYQLHEERDIRDIRISYYGGTGPMFRLIRGGTFAGMIRDRKRLLKRKPMT